MIEAELRGKVSSKLEDMEDLLTSSVFGLLKYVPPNIFWPVVLHCAKSCKGNSFLERCRQMGADIESYERVYLHFWPVHSRFGEPDVLLVFSGGEQPLLCFVIEAKLWSNKSGREHEDQLNRYLVALNDSEWLSRLTGFRGPFALPGLIYLTARATWLDLYDSIEHSSDRKAAESSLFHLQWQDILDVAQQVFAYTQEPQRSMLQSIAHFLEHRGLLYFRGFDHLSIKDLPGAEVSFYSPRKVGFSRFTEMPLDVQSLAELSLYSNIRVSRFRGFTTEPFEDITATETVFYGGN